MKGRNRPGTSKSTHSRPPETAPPIRARLAPLLKSLAASASVSRVVCRCFHPPSVGRFPLSGSRAGCTGRTETPAASRACAVCCRQPIDTSRIINPLQRCRYRPRHPFRKPGIDLKIEMRACIMTGTEIAFAPLDRPGSAGYFCVAHPITPFTEAAINDSTSLKR